MSGLALMLACDEIMKTGASHEDALAAAECALGAAAPLIVAAAYEQLADEIGQHGAAGHASAGDNHTAAMAGVTELSVAARVRRRASVLRGAVDTPMSTDTPDLPPRVQAADRRRGFRLLLAESSVDPAYDPYGVLADAPQEITVRTCRTVGELIRENFVYLLDRGEHGTLRRLMEEAADWLDEVPLPHHRRNIPAEVYERYADEIKAAKARTDGTA